MGVAQPGDERHRRVQQRCSDRTLRRSRPIHLGPKLVPPIHSGGDHGWWNLENLVVGRDQITASYRLNGMNKPKVTVDRRTGLITVKAMTDFSGRCDVGNWGNGQRRF